ncbi:MAG: hypothetical protein FJZ78_11670 [Bacteroidetes bacterium]|nr:hypothetical protein [Bacteroidota bacterium]
MDGKLIFWIIGLAIYYYLQSRKKKKEEASGESTSPPPVSPGPISFEDLLREIQSSKKPTKEPEPVSPQSLEEEMVAEEYESEIKDIGEKMSSSPYASEIEDLEEKMTSGPSEEVRPMPMYEKAKAEAFERPTLEVSESYDGFNRGRGPFQSRFGTANHSAFSAEQHSILKEEDKSVLLKGIEAQKSSALAEEIGNDLRDPDKLKKAFVLNEILGRRF